jgi:hypothetical protein
VQGRLQHKPKTSGRSSWPLEWDNDRSRQSWSEPWARKLRDQPNIGDFREWETVAEYQKSLDRLLRDLKASETK